MALVVMSVEGVLSDPVLPSMGLINTEASLSGRNLYLALKDTVSIVMVSAEPDADVVKAWLIREHFGKYAGVHPFIPGEGLGVDAWKVKKVSDLIGIGHNISFYIDSSIEAIRGVLDVGVTGILVARSGELPGRAEQEYQSWYDLTESLDRHEALRAARILEEENA